MKYLFRIYFILFTSISFGQTYLDSTINSSTKKILLGDTKSFVLGSYGEAHYNQAIENNKYKNGTADLHRIILFMGYKFTDKLQFFTEIEFEHSNELSIEQAYMDYSFSDKLNIKAGVILIPMGYINEFHEPTLFNGVERPAVDKYLIPSTWAEIGIGSHGIFKKANLKYQAYIINGFKGYDNGNALFSGKSGVRGGRQKASNTLFRTPSVTGKLTYFGVNKLRLGLSGYYGKSESTLYNNLERDNDIAVAQADSSIVGIAMVSFNAHYTIGNLDLLAIGNYTSISNTNQYNTFTSSDLAQELFGYYGEVAYNIALKESGYPRLVPFVRYENYDTQYSVDESITRNDAYKREVITAGLGLKITTNSVFKADFQWLKTETNPRPTNMINLGFGYWF